MARPQDVRIRFVGQDQTKNAFQSVRNNIQGLISGFARVAAPIGAVAGALVAVGAGLTKLGIDAAKTNDNIAKTAKQLGLTGEELQNFRIAAELGGSDINAFDRSLNRFRRSLGEAVTGSKEIADAFQRTGVDPFRLAVLDTAEAYQIYTDAVANAENETVAFADFQRILGGRSRDLFQQVRQGADAALEAQARLFFVGGLRSEEQLEQGEKIVDNITLIGKAWDGVKARFQPLADTVTSSITGWIERLVAADRQAESLGERLQSGFQGFQDAQQESQRRLTVTGASREALAVARDLQAQREQSARQEQLAAEQRKLESKQQIAFEKQQANARLQGLRLAVSLRERLLAAERAGVGRQVDSRRLGLGIGAPTQDPQIQALNKLIKKEEEKQMVEQLRDILVTLQENSFKAVAQ